MAEAPLESLSREERTARLRLIRSENVGPVTYHALMARFGNAIQALEALPELARRGGRRKGLRIASKAAADKEFAAAETVGARALFHGAPGYPADLAAVEDAPPVVFARGQAQLLESRRGVAIVGARNASANGRRLAGMLARDLGGAGWLVVSGMARGIDSAAHEAALGTGTVAVLAGGVDNVYPPENEDLYAAIADRGVILAEMPPGTEPQGRHFPRRNRVISGLSLGVVVVEAALRSGSLITARYAGDQGREVFAVPGSPLDPRCRGANNLLREGAILTESARDILEGLADMVRRGAAEPGRGGGAGIGTDVGQWGAENAAGQEDAVARRERELIEECLGPSPVAVDEIIRQCHLSAPRVLAVLLELELAGRLERHAGGRVSLLYIDDA